MRSARAAARKGWRDAVIVSEREGQAWLRAHARVGHGHMGESGWLCVYAPPSELDGKIVSLLQMTGGGVVV